MATTAVDSMKKVTKIRVLALSWRDIGSPLSGGAEVFTHAVLSRLDRERFEVVHFSALFAGAADQEVIDGVEYRRAGTPLSVVVEARRFYQQDPDRWDLVVDQCNTHRFFTKFWVPAHKRVFFIHQLTREIWFQQLPFPVGLVGWLAEVPALRLQRNDPTLTVSESTRQELLSAGFQPRNVRILPEGLDFAPWPVAQWAPKEVRPTFIYVGRFSAYKGINDALMAFGQVKQKVPQARLWIVGRENAAYRAKVLDPLARRWGLSVGRPGDETDVVYWGFVSDEVKLNLMSRSWAMLFPSHREGWGLIISEAAAVGTPSVVYDAPGTRDAVALGSAGYLCPLGSVDALAGALMSVMEDRETYTRMTLHAYELAKTLHWNRTARECELFLERVYRGAVPNPVSLPVLATRSAS